MSNEPPAPARTNLKPWLEFGPLVVFLLVNARWGLLTATAVLVPLSLVALIVSWRRDGKVAPMALFGTLAVLVFGGISLLLHDEELFKLKLTVVYCLLGIVLLVGHLRGKAPIRAVLGANLALTDEGWRRLTVRFTCFCFFLALLNEVMRRWLSSDAWAIFKVLGVSALLFGFMLAQAPLLAKHAPPESEPGA